jgi:predicted Zn-dependent protease with MMP-like domain
VTREQFDVLVEEALGTIPERFRDALKNVAIVVEDEPTPDQLASIDDELDEDEDAGDDGDMTLLGLYEGTPLTERKWDDGNRLPDKVTLFQGPIEDASEDEDDVVIAIGETLIHEIGHYFGLSEDEIQAIEEDYWRGGR